tara:strand:+ start:46 stop:285 length:240 start_codon:yes stop_codon:yes gene_type:complete
MNQILYIIGMASLTVLLINAEPFRWILKKMKLQDKKLFNCALCFGFWLSLLIAAVLDLGCILIPISAVLASFIDKKLYE